MPRLFALDHNFPDPIVEALTEYQASAELVRIDAIDDRMADLQDWELLLALRHDAAEWDGLITTDSSILNQGAGACRADSDKADLDCRDGSRPQPGEGIRPSLRVPRRHLREDRSRRSAGMDAQSGQQGPPQAVGFPQELRRTQQPRDGGCMGGI